MKKKLFLSVIFFGYLFCGCDKSKLESEMLTFEYNEQMHSRVISKLPDSAELMKDFSPSEQLILSDKTLVDFKLIDIKDFSDESSTGLIVTGEYSIEGIQIRKEIKTTIIAEIFYINKVEIN